MLNHIDLIGYLTRDPELRRTGTGKPVTSFTLACERDYSSHDGSRETDFIDIVTWNAAAEFVSKFFAKGRKAAVSGRLQIRNWTDKDGNKRKSAEVIADHVYFADSKKQDTTAQNRYPAPEMTPASFIPVYETDIEDPDDLEGFIPF